MTRPQLSHTAQATQSHALLLVFYSRHPPSPSHHLPLDNRLQLPRIPQRILNDLIARNQNVLAQVIILLLREVYPAILDDPPTLLRKVDDATLRIEEQERLGVGHGDRGVRALAAGRDFLADCADENL
jgi:hypothetical protein